MTVENISCSISTKECSYMHHTSVGSCRSGERPFGIVYFFVRLYLTHLCLIDYFSLPLCAGSFPIYGVSSKFLLLTCFLAILVLNAKSVDPNQTPHFVASELHLITKTRLYNFEPLKPHFYIVKLGFTGVYIISLIYVQNRRLWVLVRTASSRRF